MSKFIISVSTYNLPTRPTTPPQNPTPKASVRKSLVYGQIMLVNKICFIYLHAKNLLLFAPERIHLIYTCYATLRFLEGLGGAVHVSACTISPPNQHSDRRQALLFRTSVRGPT